MKTTTARSLVQLVLLLLPSLAPTQGLLRHIVTSEYEDMAEAKRKAKGGDVRAQSNLASLAVQFHSADALQWYGKAARQGDLECFCRASHMLLYGAIGIPQDQAVPGNPAEGIRIVFRAATNRYHEASDDMYWKGVNDNLIS